MAKITVTPKILSRYPELADYGIEVGEEIESEKFGLSLEDVQNLADDTGEDPGGDRPKKPPIRP